jgi:quercetin dioxygenase-like cupin family protein
LQYGQKIRIAITEERRYMAMRYFSTAAALPLVLGLTMGGAGVVFGTQAAEHAREAAVYTPDQIEWQDGPPSLPAGAEWAILEGDPSKEGEYFAFQIRVPDGYRIPPHWHPVPERVTVLSGTFHLGKGETFDAGATQALPAGSYFTMPAEMRHFARMEGETVFQLNSIGPWDIRYVNPEDDPRKVPTEP